LMGKSFALLEDFQNAIAHLELAIKLGGESEELDDDLKFVCSCI